MTTEKGPLDLLRSTLGLDADQRVPAHEVPLPRRTQKPRPASYGLSVGVMCMRRLQPRSLATNALPVTTRGGGHREHV